MVNTLESKNINSSTDCDDGDSQKENRNSTNHNSLAPQNMGVSEKGSNDFLDTIIKALNVSDNGILIHDKENILYSNDSLSKRIEVPKKLVEVGAPLLDMQSYCAGRGDFGENITGRDIIERAGERNKKGDTYETQRITPSGKYIRARVVPCDDDITVATYNDVTELIEAQKKAEAADYAKS